MTTKLDKIRKAFETQFPVPEGVIFQANRGGKTGSYTLDRNNPSPGSIPRADECNSYWFGFFSAWKAAHKNLAANSQGLRPTAVVPVKEKSKRISGAGVKPSDGCSPLGRKQVLIDTESDEILSLIGNGQLSLGIREAARRLVDSGDTGAFDAGRHAKRTKI
jgi:hypothetical protein